MNFTKQSIRMLFVTVLIFSNSERVFSSADDLTNSNDLENSTGLYDLINLYGVKISGFARNNETIGEKSIMKIRKNLKEPPNLKIPREPSHYNIESERRPMRWISQPLRKGLQDFAPNSLVRQKCNQHVHIYKEHLKNETLWAIRMSESTQSEVIGLIGGTTYQMGNYEECVKTRGPNEIRGKYCLAKLKYALRDELAKRVEHQIGRYDFREADQRESVWKGIVRIGRDPVRLDRRTLYWGICMPASCEAQDLQVSLNDSLFPHFQQSEIQLDLSVDSLDCSTNEQLPFTKGFYITICFMLSWLSIILVSTFLDIAQYVRGTYQDDTSGLRELLATFSAWRNIYSLGIYNKDSQVKLVNTIKFLMMLIIIYGHGLIYMLGYPQFNPAGIEEVYRRGADVGLVNTNIVDVFFALSGFLTFYYGYQPMKIGGTVYLILSIFFRYIRLMPIFAFIVAYVIYILPYTSDGPVWNSKIGVEVENCKENWLLSVLMINNIFNVKKQCVLVSWYVYVDMQLCIVASVLLFFVARRPKFGVSVSVLVFILSSAITYMVTYKNAYSGLLKLYMTFLENPRRSEEYEYLYSAIYSRAGPYLVGFLSGYIAMKLQEKKITFSNKALLIGLVLGIAIGEGSQYYGVVFYKYERPYFPIENALYAATHRIIFAGAISWILILYVTSGLGVLNSIINHRIFTVLSRVTYSVYLINTLVMIWMAASFRTPLYASYKMIMMLSFGNMVTSYIAGFLFYLYMEAPVCGISKLMQKQLAKLFAAEIDEAKKKAELTDKSDLNESKTTLTA